MLASCAGTAGSSSTGSGSRTASAAAGATSGTASTAGGGKGGTFTLALAGDVHFTGRTAKYPADPAPMAAALKPLADADLAVLNLETAITDRGAPEPKQFHFRAPATALNALQQAGIDAVSMANNHGVDYGAQGLADSLAAQAKSPIPVIGIGPDENAAFAPAMLTAKGHKVAVIGATQVNDRTMQAWSATATKPGVASARDVTRLTQAVRAARTQADVVVVFLHWGVERMPCPSTNQKSLASELAAAGADVVVGSHAHRFQGAGWTDGGTTYVDYGLGNFVWWLSNGKPAISTGVLTLTLDGRRTTKADWTPMLIGSDGLPHVAEGVAATSELADWNKARDCTGLAATAS